MKSQNSEPKAEPEEKPVESCQMGGGSTATKSGYEHIVATNEEPK